MNKLQEQIGYQFSNIENLKLALTHPSYLGGKQLTAPKTTLSNQRLEFLGDSILNLILTLFLVEKHPISGEGELTKFRSSFVCGQSLTVIGDKLGLRSLLLTADPYEVSDGDVADAVEALIAAVYVDGDLLAAERVILNLFESYLEQGFMDVFVDHKSNFQKLVHKRFPKVEPRYSTSEVRDGTFVCFVYVRDDVIGCGYGASKKKAEVNAAEDACEVFTQNVYSKEA